MQANYHELFLFFCDFQDFRLFNNSVFSDCLLLFGSRATPKIQRHFRRQRENGHFGRFWTQLESVQDSKIFRLRLSRTPQRFFTRQRVHSRGQIHRTQGDFYLIYYYFYSLYFFCIFSVSVDLIAIIFVLFLSLRSNFFSGLIL